VAKNKKTIKGFICASKERNDENAAKKLRKRLQHEDEDVIISQPWWPREDLLPGENENNEIMNALEECSYFIPLYSSSLLNNPDEANRIIQWAEEEFKKYPPNCIWAIPAKLDECKIPNDHSTIGQRKAANLFPNEEDFNYGVRQIQKSILIHIAGCTLPSERKNVAENIGGATLSTGESIKNDSGKSDQVKLILEGNQIEIELSKAQKIMAGKKCVPILGQIAENTQMESLTNFLNQVKYYWGGWTITVDDGKQKLKEKQPVPCTEVPAFYLPDKNYLIIMIAVSVDKAILAKALDRKILTADEAAQVIWVIYQ